MKQWKTTTLDGTPVDVTFIEMGRVGEQSLAEYEPVCFPLNFRPTQNGHQYEQVMGYPVCTFYDWMGTGEDHTTVVRQGTDSGGGEDHVRGFGAFVGRLGPLMTQPLYVGLQHRGQSQGNPYSWLIGVEIPVSYIPNGFSGWVIVTFAEPWISGDALDILALSYEPYAYGVGWVWGYGEGLVESPYPYGVAEVWRPTESNPDPHWEYVSSIAADMMFVLLEEGGVNCWKCLDSPNECEECGGYNTCDSLDGNYPAKVLCEAITTCGGSSTYDCYYCDSPGNPCVLHTGQPNPCDESTSNGWSTQTACQNATDCEIGPTDPIAHEFLTCDASDYDHCWDIGSEGPCDGDPLCEWYEHWPGCGPVTNWNEHPPSKSTFDEYEIVWVYGRFDCDYPDPWGCGGWGGRYLKYELWEDGGAEPLATSAWGPITSGWETISLVWWLTKSAGTYNVKVYWGDTSSCPNYLDTTHFTVTAPPCSTWGNKLDCESHDCYWYNNACHSTSPSCTTLNNEPDCLDYNCYWYNGSCHGSAPSCTILNNEPDCTAYNCHWYNGSCHGLIDCETVNNQIECEALACYWYDGSCHSDQYVGEPIGEIHPTTNYTTGSLPPGTIANVINPLVISNTGTAGGQINWAIYEEGNPTPLANGNQHIVNGFFHSFGPIALTTPATSGIWNLCLTVWAEGYETEPICSYSTMLVQ